MKQVAPYAFIWCLSIDVVTIGCGEVFERKIQNMVFGSTRIGNNYRVKVNNDIEVVQRINIHGVCWLSNFVRMEENVPATTDFFFFGSRTSLL